jgi:hypothetical protein
VPPRKSPETNRSRRAPSGGLHPIALACAALVLPLAACSPSPSPPAPPSEVVRQAAPTAAGVGAPSDGGGAGTQTTSPAAASEARVALAAPAAPATAKTAPGAAVGSREDASTKADVATAASRSSDAAPPMEQRPHRARFGSEAASSDVHRLADWVVDTADNLGLPFIVVDKKQAKVFVFGPDGRLWDASPALLGLARGDDSVPGIGERRMSDIRPAERTTPAGRFVAEPGFNSQGEDILWVDYDAAVSMHRVRATNPAERRLQRLASATVRDNRISYGCINLPAAFYDLSVKPAFAARGGIVYVLPETRPLAATFPALRAARLAQK